jgi:hypothetical protein
MKTFLIITRLILPRMRRISEYCVRENHETHFLLNRFFRNVFVRERGKNMVETVKQNMTR